MTRYRPEKNAQRNEAPTQKLAGNDSGDCHSTLSRHTKERDAFIGRLHALDKAQDQLTSEIWERASLSAMVNRALAPAPGAALPTLSNGDRAREERRPPVNAAKEEGFGSHLIERAFGGELGRAQLVFDHAALLCTLEIAL
jgi:HWE histidine kinase